uniref:Uncharacterized protein n=1 Tax=Mucochytrium quahogii TaxID=96639 RepID=A0A7S2WD98_9STRA|mmetsp:Transcript_7965/g.14608  ORF Transcript_7965/g.14608 Transcript_7965/m.14608 type:complete len:755 (+) Transcript_7965:218-2482(+)|eukprot:CAMPEP_0203756798 /NCGR_PEP_ID=MMETSP0098-20131031/10002_1 /ASSEMBLY_ACC=CAM_ASM_000208 /TAXON_ID=96639 /ORGANISM=" , Strain NY0313808BC1" /LENGTH=754 /DNA_ID=CAMNT_0050648797 /DNA_START=173 /DNA_END=2433 /DNA_ORIENTATION=+
MADTKTKSERIQELVQQMKAGSISKSELFSQLSQLQRVNRQGNEGVSTQSAQDQIPPKVERGESPKARGSTPERRAMIIQRLFDEKRRKQAGGNQVQQQEELYVDDASEGSTDAHMRSSERRLLLQQHLNRKRPSSAPRGGRKTPGGGRSPGSTINGASSLSPNDAGNLYDIDLGGRDAWTSSNSKQRGQDKIEREGSSRNYIYDSRLRRLHEDLRVKQMEECTFKPKIRKLPEEYGMRRTEKDGLSFDERINRWNERKLQDTERKRKEREENELKECTFRPQINSKTRRPRTPEPSRNRGRQESSRHEPTTPNSMYGEEDLGYAATRRESASERLYRESKNNKLAELQARARMEEEEKLRKVCTFQPNINRQRPLGVRSKYRTPTPTRTRRPMSAGPRGRNEADSVSSSSSFRKKHAWDEECTFTPQTNPIHPGMEAAQVYLSNDIFSRLTKSRDALYGEVENDERENNMSGDDRVMDMTTFLASNSQKNRARPSSAPRQRRPDENQRTNGSPKKKELSREEKLERRKNFDAFIARQNQREIRKQQKIEQVSKQIARTHKPKLCKNSVKIVKNNIQGSFLQRVAKDALRKEHETVRLKTRNHDPECTFQPKITKSAKKRPGRSAVEMSRGDSLRKETNARMMKLKVEQEEHQELTFTPEVNTTHKNTEGRLKILSEPETYIRRLQHKTTLQSHRQTLAAQENEMKELGECTFKPEIHDAPKYVKRIVRSLALAKPAREMQAAAKRRQEKPEWR